MNPSSLPQNPAVPAPAATRVMFAPPTPPRTPIPTAPTPTAPTADLAEIRLAHAYYLRGNFHLRRSVHFFFVYSILWLISVVLCLLGAYLPLHVLVLVAFFASPFLFFALAWALVWWWMAYEVLVEAKVVSRERGELSPTQMERVFMRYLGEAD